jgi:hypothetical protein
MKQYEITVFGKEGCSKCKTLNQRLDKLLEKSEWDSFTKQYCSLDTVEGLVEFCRAECINPQRIPAFVVRPLNDNGKPVGYVPNLRLLSQEPPPHEHVRLHQHLGLQTDYSETGRGLLTPDMIKDVLRDALDQ